MITPIKVQLRVNSPAYRELCVFQAEKYGAGHAPALGFEGITGTIVHATDAAWGGFQITVQLDEPHRVFGWEYGKCIYIFADDSRRRDVVADIISDHTRADVARFARFCEWAGWGRTHTSSGDPLSWSQMERVIEDRLQHMEN